jgi:methylaspartate mutase sigma subunit
METSDPILRTPIKVLLSSVSSDAHTWNLVFVQLLLEEMGHEVINLGACVPDATIVDECRRSRPDLVVISTVNGHGAQDGLRLIRKLRAKVDLGTTRVVIGGKLGIHGTGNLRLGADLIDAGFDGVFEDDNSIAQPLEAYRQFLATIPRLRVPASGIS